MFPSVRHLTWDIMSWPQRCLVCLSLVLLGWIMAIIAWRGLLLLAGSEDSLAIEARQYREKRAALISECVEARLDPSMSGYRVLPKTWAGISKANDDCRATLDALIQMSRK